MEVIMEEIEIDLRRYIKALLNKWWLVAGLAIISAVLALAVSFIRPPTYEAQVYVATTRLKTQVQFGTEIRSLTEEELAATGVKVDRQARLAAFRALVMSPQIAQTVLPEFEERLSKIGKALADPARFLPHVKGAISEDSDLIVITVSLSDPQLAADIANAWGQAYEELINNLYSGARTQDLEVVQDQTEQARQDYMSAEKELETYLADNPIPSLERQISILQAQIDSYQSGLVEAERLTTGREMATRRELLDAYYADLVTLQLLLDDARMLKQQLTASEGSPSGAFGDALALVLLHSRAFSDADSPLITLEFQTTLEANNITAADVESLIAALDTQMAETDAKIKELTTTLLTPSETGLPEDADEEIAARIRELTTEMQMLEAQLEAEVTNKQDLESQRDLAWTTYTMLAQTEAEVMVDTQSGSTEVRLASQAVPPAKPTSPRKSLSAAVAAAMGLVVGVFSVFAIEWWQREDRAEGKVGRAERPAEK
jgi:succinoglycan biosynthesis transport protein ExoP